MYSNKDNVNILTALLVKWGVRRAVVCPGSRNAPLVHNFNECPDIECYAVTDERSAGFFALGLSQVDDEPVAVCVTSGSALLNVSPAVAEALYQHRKLIIISADRPACMIGQLQGQTLPQPHALQELVRAAVNLPEPHDETERWYCNRLINEAFIEMNRGEGGPVHINVPISEPLFNFNKTTLPDERKIEFHQSVTDKEALSRLAYDFGKAKRPMLVIGQCKREKLKSVYHELLSLTDTVVILYEKLSSDSLIMPQHLDEVLLRTQGAEEEYLPDFIIYMGDTFVNKRIKEFLRKAKLCRTAVVNRDGAVRDVFMNLTDVVQANEADVVSVLYDELADKNANEFALRWFGLFESSLFRRVSDNLEFSQLSAVDCLISFTLNQKCYYHFANSMPLRLGLMLAKDYIYANRGVNGIEGCLSTAVGFSCGVDLPVYCVIGDLSFFYDQNALWNENLGGNLRILLLNNGGGGIFRQLPGLRESGAFNEYIAASHETTAEGICLENSIRYFQAHSNEELEEGMRLLTDADEDFPVLLEVFTHPDTDEKVLRDFLYSDLKSLN